MGAVLKVIGFSMIAEILQFILGISIADQKCKEYSFKTRPLIPSHYFCVQPLPLVIGGENVTDGEFPHMAIIGFQSSGSSELHWVCGGSLISESFVLTAAHCSNSPEFGVARRVRLGCVTMDYKSHYQERTIIEIIVHPDRKGYYNDIALFRLEQPVEFSFYVRPACLSTEMKLESDSVIATGFGVTEYTSSTLSNHMKKTTLKVYSTENCTKIYQNISKEFLPRGILPSQLCAGNPTGDSDTCNGDSGGPLQVRSLYAPCMHYIVGITSFGLFCGQPNMPSFSTRISYYVQWIERIVWPK